MPFSRPKRRFALTLLGISLVAAACGSADGSAGNGLPSAAPPSTDGRVHIVAAESLWGEIAQQIGGHHVDVTSILSDPSQDPHEYQTSVGDAAAIDNADLVIVNGLDYDPFMKRLLSVASKPRRAVLTVADIVGARDGGNPHLWYDPDYVVRAANALEAAIATEDRAHAAQFEAGLAGFRRGEQRVVALVAEIKTKHAGDKIGYTERVPGYLVQAAGLQLGTPSNFSLALENGTDPSPGDSARFEQAISKHLIKALLLNTQVVDPETERLAELAGSNNVPVVDVSETLPRHENFQTWQAAQAAALLKALDDE